MSLARMQLYHALICACMNFGRFVGWLVSLKERWKRLNPEIQLTSNFRHASVSSLLFTPPCLLYLYLACIWFAPVFDLYLICIFVCLLFWINDQTNKQLPSGQCLCLCSPCSRRLLPPDFHVILLSFLSFFVPFVILFRNTCIFPDHCLKLSVSVPGFPLPLP